MKKFFKASILLIPMVIPLLLFMFFLDHYKVLPIWAIIVIYVSGVIATYLKLVGLYYSTELTIKDEEFTSVLNYHKRNLYGALLSLVTSWSGFFVVTTAHVALWSVDNIPFIWFKLYFKESDFSQLRKKMRNRIYKLALSNLIYYRNGLCSAIDRSLRFLEIKIDPYNSMHLFPEVYKRKPLDFDTSTRAYWFPLHDEGFQIRKEILEQAIKETEL